MDFELSDEQRALADSVARFTQKDYDFAQRRALLDGGEGFSRAHWALFADLGWLGAGLSEEAGGFGGGAIETSLIAEGFGRALVLEPFLSTAVLSLQTLAALPPNPDLGSLVSGIVAGELLVALAHGEASSRGNIDRVETRANFEGSQWRLSGTKILVFGAPSADRLLVSAQTADGIALFCVAPGASGLGSAPYRALDNQRVADLFLDNVPAELLAPPGAAMTAITAGIDHAVIAICAEAIGSMDEAIRLTRDYLKERRQFGAPLASFQALQHRMADMFVEAELSRSMLYQALAAVGGDSTERHRAVAMTKSVVSTAAMFVGRQAIQLHGAIGMTEEYAIGHHYRRLFVIAGQFGGEALHLTTVARLGRPFWPSTGDDRSPDRSH